jgi:hypothetical protein
MSPRRSRPGLAILAAAATPALAAIAVLGVVRGRRRALLLLPVLLGAVAPSSGR